MVEGWNVVGSTWLTSKGLKKNTRKVVAGAIVGSVGLGLICLSREPLMAFRSTLARIDAIFLKSFVYRL